MKKIILPLTALCLLGTSAFAESCVLPEFIKEGVKIEYQAEMSTQRATIVKIDKKSCWMKVDNGKWINLNAIPWIKL